MRRALAVAALAAAGLCAGAETAASGGWEWARFGMTSAEVRVASKGAARPAQSAFADELAAPFALGKFRFHVTFNYEADRLAEVDLALEKVKDCPALQAWLEKTRGPGEETYQQAYQSRLWRDGALGDDVSFTVVTGFSCHILYRPLTTDTGE